MPYKFLFSLFLLLHLAGFSFAQPDVPGPSASNTDQFGNRHIKRTALVVAVNNYQTLTPLNNALNDGRAIYAKLRQMGFDADTLFNPDIDQLNKALAAWQNNKLDFAGQGLFYFCGHGFSINNEENYLVPKSDAFDYSRKTQAETHCISVRKVKELMDEARVPIQFLILDACRSYSDNMENRWFGINQGFSSKYSYMLFYSTKQGFTASDGPKGGHSFFASALIETIDDNRYNLYDMMNAVIGKVKKATNNEQQPHFMNSIANFCFYSGSDCDSGRATIISASAASKNTDSRSVKEAAPFPDSIWNNPNKVLLKADFLAAINNITLSAKCYERAATLSNPEGFYKLGCMYQFGNGVEIDYKKAFSYFQKGAEMEHSECLRKLGVFYSFEIYKMLDFKKAKDLFQLAAIKGNANAMSCLGRLYFNGQGVPKDYAKAMEWYKKAADKGDAWAFCAIACLYQNGQGVARDYSRAMEWNKKAADLGDVAAMDNIGFIYENGQGVPKDYFMAIEYYKKAAEMGYAKAMGRLGYLYYRGLGVPQDFYKAMEWYKKAASLGEMYATQNIGVLYYQGAGVKQDFSKAFEWYKKAADMGNAVAMNDLGDMYENGNGVAKDLPKAVYYYNLAVENGCAFAWYSLGLLYFSGIGVEQSYVKAFENLQKASDAGVTDAMLKLSEMYRMGLGLNANDEKAKYWEEKSKGK